MWRVLLVLLLAGCVQLPPSPQDIQAKKFESATPDKSVIYIVRAPMDSREGGTISLDDNAQVTTYAGTYYRWEVAPGPHRIAGYAGQGVRVCRRPAEAGAQGGRGQGDRGIDGGV